MKEHFEKRGSWILSAFDHESDPLFNVYCGIKPDGSPVLRTVVNKTILDGGQENVAQFETMLHHMMAGVLEDWFGFTRDKEGQTNDHA